MSKEIKEILDVKIELYMLKQFAFKNSNDMAYIESLSKTIEEYITNLQEQLHKASLDIQELTERDIWCPSNCDKLTNLQSRIDKAIEYIKDDMYSEPNELNGLVDGVHLLKILKGEDKE